MESSLQFSCRHLARSTAGNIENGERTKPAICIMPQPVSSIFERPESHCSPTDVCSSRCECQMCKYCLSRLLFVSTDFDRSFNSEVLRTAYDDELCITYAKRLTVNVHI